MIINNHKLAQNKTEILDYALTFVQEVVDAKSNNGWLILIVAAMEFN